MVVYDEKYVRKMVAMLKELGHSAVAELLWTLYKEASFERMRADKAEGRLGSMGIEGYEW